MNTNEQNNIGQDSMKSLTRKLNISVVIIVILSIALAVVSFALGLAASERLNNNKFSSGEIDISISQINNISVIDVIEPGMTFFKNFSVTNNSEIDVYYKVYFTNLSGSLQNVLNIKVVEKSSGTVLYEGLAKDFVKTNSSVISGSTLAASGSEDASQEIEITFKFPETAGNNYKNAELNFDLTVLAVQTKNNPDKNFD